VKRLFISLPNPLPDNLIPLAWRLSGEHPENGEAASPAELPAAEEIWLAFPADRVLLSSLKLSRSALRQLNGSLGNALEDQLMLDPASVHVALGSGGKILSDDVHPIAVIESAWLEQTLAWCRRYGIEPAGATPETLLWIGAEGPESLQTHWNARWTGHDGFVRSGQTAGFALDDGGAEMPPLAMQLAMAEASRNNQKPDTIVLETQIDVDAAAWSRILDCPVIMQTLQPDPHPPSINLLQGTYAPRRRRGWLGNLVDKQHAGKYRIAAGLAFAALTVHVLGTVADWTRLSWENRKLRDEMSQVFKDTFPQTQVIVDPVLQMRRQLADLRRTRGYTETGDFLHALSMAGGQVGGVTGLRYENGRLILEQPLATDL
jgi:general secretion pathway protein L